MDNRFQKILDDINTSSKLVKVLPCNYLAKKILSENYEINSESLLGAILENTGGIIIDNWIRVYGAGDIDFVLRNKFFPFSNIVVAEDILGGLFVYLDNGNIGYFAPDCLQFEDMEISLSQFLYWCLHGDTDTFYKDYRWDNWQSDVLDLPNDKGVAFYPFLWAKSDFEKRARSVVPIEEIMKLEFDFYQQFQEKSD